MLTVDQEEVVHRLLKRAQDEGRSDDTEEVMRHRQEVYAEQTAPLIEVYDERGLLVEVDGMGTVDEVTARVLEALGRPPAPRPPEPPGRACSATAASRSRRLPRST